MIHEFSFILFTFHVGTEPEISWEKCQDSVRTKLILIRHLENLSRHKLKILNKMKNKSKFCSDKMSGQNKIVRTFAIFGRKMSDVRLLFQALLVVPSLLN